MKKGLLFLSAIFLLFFACKKDHSLTPNSTGKKYKVVFSVSNFAAYRANFALRQHGLALRQHNLTDSVVSVESYLNVLYYLVFDGNGNYIKTISQDSTMCSQFGIITDSLASGTYYIAIAAGKSGMGNYPGTTRIDSYYSYNKGFAWQDAFFAGFNITVGNSPLSRDIILHRSVSKFELHVLDSIPHSVSTIALSLEPEFWNLSYNTGTLPVSTTGGGKDSVIYTMPESAKGHTGFTLDRIVSDTYGYYPTYAVITCRDAANHILVQKIVGNLIFFVNQRTVLSGNLFAPNSGFQVSVDTAWGGTKHQSF